jgi:ribosomal-protein-alanine N-acetyltransferase
LSNEFSPRVSVARGALADRAALIRANQDSRAYHVPWVEPFIDDAGFDAWFARSMTGPNVGLVTREITSARVVGVVNISDIVLGAFRGAYLGYYGMAWCAGRGLMTEAVGLAVRYVFDTLGLHRVEVNIQPGNAHSIALVRRLGFTREGFSPRYLHIDGDWRDHEQWARLADQDGSVNAPA